MGWFLPRTRRNLFYVLLGKSGAYEVPATVTNLGGYSFYSCTTLTDVTLPFGISIIGEGAFSYCTALARVRFRGDAPVLGDYVFWVTGDLMVYYLPGAANWGPDLGGLQTALWVPVIQPLTGDFGTASNEFNFEIVWASGQTVVVEAEEDLSAMNWIPVSTNLLTADSLHFVDPGWTNYPARFYRVRTP